MHSMTFVFSSQTRRARRSRNQPPSVRLGVLRDFVLHRTPDAGWASRRRLNSESVHAISSALCTVGPVEGTSERHTDRPAMLFDLDGTLLDSVYQHVLAWREALYQEGIELSVWRIHRRIGMSGGLFLKALTRETGRELGPEQAERLKGLPPDAYRRPPGEGPPLPRAPHPLQALTPPGPPWGPAPRGAPAPPPP